ncbi:MAG: ribonuclease H-like domain-containing protein [Pseudomonadota bacterium]
MGRLRDRLRRHLSAPPGGGAAPPEAREGADALPGSLEDTPEGPVRVLRFDAPALPGPVPTICLCAPVTALHHLLSDPRLEGFERASALFFDVEATGLSRGAGTFPFLIGLAWYEGDRLVVEQLLAEHPGQERAALHRFLARLGERSHFVSYNGKSYDVAVLHSRLVVNRFMERREAELRIRPHLDLLHTGRRLWRGTLPDHRLGTLETHLLDLVREGDVPGALVPHLYFAWVNTGDAAGLCKVLEHNRQDVLSMVSLAHLLLAGLAPEAPCPTTQQRVNRARIHGRAGRWDAVADALDGWAGALDPILRDEAVDLLDQAWRRLERPARRLALWEEHCQGSESPEHWERYALVLERVAKDPGRALNAARRAAALCAGPPPEALERRIERLAARVARRH